MRTTLNVADDVLRSLRQESERSRTSFRETVDRVLRLGLARAQPPKARPPYRCPAFDMGVPQGLDLDKALQLAALLEDHETIRTSSPLG